MVICTRGKILPGASALLNTTPHTTPLKNRPIILLQTLAFKVLGYDLQLLDYV